MNGREDGLTNSGETSLLFCVQRRYGHVAGLVCDLRDACLRVLPQALPLCCLERRGGAHHQFISPHPCIKPGRELSPWWEHALSPPPSWLVILTLRKLDQSSIPTYCLRPGIPNSCFGYHVGLGRIKKIDREVLQAPRTEGQQQTPVRTLARLSVVCTHIGGLVPLCQY